MTVELIHGDCLDVMDEMEAQSVNAAIMDPPYCSGARTAAKMVHRGGMSRKAKWKSKPMANDRMTTVGFLWLMRHVAAQCERLLPESGSLLSFIDWRQYPNLYGAIESVNLRVHALVVWDKMSMALGNGFRNQHELIIHASKGSPDVHDRGTPNVLRFKRISSSDIHPTEKPVDLLEELIQVICPPGGTVLDPMMGSGTTGVACVQTGRNFIGIELDAGYFDIARQRIAAAQSEMVQLELINST